MWSTTVLALLLLQPKKNWARRRPPTGSAGASLWAPPGACRSWQTSDARSLVSPGVVDLQGRDPEVHLSSGSESAQ